MENVHQEKNSRAFGSNYYLHATKHWLYSNTFLNRPFCAGLETCSPPQIMTIINMYWQYHQVVFDYQSQYYHSEASFHEDTLPRFFPESLCIVTMRQVLKFFTAHQSVDLKDKFKFILACLKKTPLCWQWTSVEGKI